MASSMRASNFSKNNDHNEFTASDKKKQTKCIMEKAVQRPKTFIKICKNVKKTHLLPTKKQPANYKK